MTHQVLFLTQRGLRHQQAAIDAAPPELDILMRREPSQEEVLALLPEVEFLISERAGIINAAMFEAGRNLRLVQRLGRQTWDIDLEAAKQANVPVCCQPIAGCQQVAEHMILQALALIKHLREVVRIAEKAGQQWGKPRECTEDYFAYNWSNRENIDGLFGKTMGILGFGEIGLELARRLRAFDCEVLYHKRNRLPAEAEQSLEITFANLETLQKQTDVLFNLLPDFAETRHLLDTGFFETCKQGLYLVHAGGGTTIHAESVVHALRSGQLAGASLDTFNWEPIRSDDPLVMLAKEKTTNLILTPHVAGGTQTDQAYQRAFDYKNLIALISGQELQNRVA